MTINIKNPVTIFENVILFEEGKNILILNLHLKIRHSFLQMCNIFFGLKVINIYLQEKSFIYRRIQLVHCSREVFHRYISRLHLKIT